MVSANGLGPKVYGIFDGGMIQHFYHVSFNFSYIFGLSPFFTLKTELECWNFYCNFLIKYVLF